MILTQTITTTQYAWLFGLVAGGVIVGFIFEYVLIRFMRSFAKRTKWKGDDVITESIGHIFTLWVGAFGLYAGIQQLPLSTEWSDHVQTASTITWILFGTVLVMRITSGLVEMYANEKNKLQNSSIFTNLTKFVVIVLGGLIVLQTLNISITPLLTAVGVGSLAIALGLQETLSNLFSGLSIIAARKIQIGDFIQLDSGQEGYVDDIDWRHTTIKAVSAKTIIVPNAVLAKAIVTNYTLLREEKSVVVEIGIGYEEDLEKVEKKLVEIAKKVIESTEGADTSFEPLARYKEFGDSAIACNVIMRANNYGSHFRLRHEFIKRAHRELASANISIPYPTQEIYLKK